MPYYRSLGEIPAKRHVQFRASDGSLYHEHLISKQGFSAESSLLYRRHPPTSVMATTTSEASDETVEQNLPLRPRHFVTGMLGVAGDPVTGRRLMFANDDVRVSMVVADAASGLYRNTAGDEVLFVHSGAGRYESEFGVVVFGPGDFVVVPTSTTGRWVIAADEPLRALVVESRGHIGPPARYVGDRGQFLESSPYCERDLHGPTELSADSSTEIEVRVRSWGAATTHTLAHHPFDVVGWDGCLYPYRFSVHDFEPITGRIHQPPPVHQVFEAPGMVICAFVPRKVDYHPQAIPAPYYHSNVDSDEVLFYVDGDFMSRAGSGVGEASVTLHPAGHVHGPQPGGIEASIGVESTAETAIMVDTFAPLMINPASASFEDPDYLSTWTR